MTRIRALFLSALFGVLIGADAASAGTDQPLPPSPYRILDVSLRMLPIDARDVCLGEPTHTKESPGPLGTQPIAETSAGSKGPVKASEDRRDADQHLQEAIRAARTAPADLGSWKRLATAVERPASPLTKACGWLELARLELRIGRVPEARLTATRALEPFADEERPSAIRRAVDFYRAESLGRSGDAEASLAIHSRLASTPDAVGRASAVRIADHRWSTDPNHAHRLELEHRVTTSEMSASPVWAPRLSEIAIADGDFESAARWLDVAVGGDTVRSDELDAAIAVRRADLLFRAGGRKDREEGQQILRELSDQGRTDPIRRLALIREIELGKRITKGARRRLERTMRLASPRLHAYAGHVLARSLVASSDFSAALDVMVELVHRKAHAPHGEIDSGLFDEILAGLFASGACDDWIEAVGGRRELLLRYASAAEPFLRLGDCYLEAGLAGAALETYRGIAKSFGPTSVGAVTLRSAQSEFALGRTNRARAAARANVRAGTEPRDGWRALYARIQLSDGQSAEASRTLRPLLERISKSPVDEWEPDDPDAILLSARAAAADPNSTEHDLLARALRHPLGEDERDRTLAEASILVADLYRRTGRIDPARDLYERSLSTLEKGGRRSRTAYWLGVLAQDPDEARAFWSRVAEDDDPWARMAANEIALAEGRAAVGEPLSVPSPRFPAATEGVSE